MVQAEVAQQQLEKVLVVDDDERLRALLQQILELNGFQVSAVSSVEAALSEIDVFKPDIIVSDIVMPTMDGHTFFQLVKEDSRKAHIPFIFLSALSDPQNIIRGKEFGCDDYISKPFDPAELVATIRGKIKQSRLRDLAFKERLDAHHRRIVNTLSHEFRTPLVAVKTGTELLLESASDLNQANVQKLLESVYRGSERLQRLVDDFMLVQQIDSGYAATVKNRLQKNFSLALIAEMAITCMSEIHFEPGIHADCKPQIELVLRNGEDNDQYLACVYDIHVTNIVQRLLSNAFKFGGAKNIITVTVERNLDEVAIRVSDRGPGLPDIVAKQACRMFEQIDRDKMEQQGCGFGLAIASYFTELNGGKILFSKPEDGVGLEVKISFPAIN